MKILSADCHPTPHGYQVTAVTDDKQVLALVRKFREEESASAVVDRLKAAKIIRRPELWAVV